MKARPRGCYGDPEGIAFFFMRSFLSRGVWIRHIDHAVEIVRLAVELNLPPVNARPQLGDIGPELVPDGPV
ncbi:MAG: hypothetical protein CMJ25_08100 [Phycisphaerae bacterium]|nr:hypothetical protein [Phycisphaerae bacterium]